MSQANTLAELRGLSPFIALQIEYSLIERTPDVSSAYGSQPRNDSDSMAVLGSGVLTGKYNDAPPSPTKTNGPTGVQVERRLDAGNSQKANERNITIARLVVDVAKEIGCTPSQVALAWLRTAPVRLFQYSGPVD